MLFNFNRITHDSCNNKAVNLYSILQPFIHLQSNHDAFPHIYLTTSSPIIPAIKSIPQQPSPNLQTEPPHNIQPHKRQTHTYKVLPLSLSARAGRHRGSPSARAPSGPRAVRSRGGASERTPAAREGPTALRPPAAAEISLAGGAPAPAASGPKRRCGRLCVWERRRLFALLSAAANARVLISGMAGECDFGAAAAMSDWWIGHGGCRNSSMEVFFLVCLGTVW